MCLQTNAAGGIDNELPRVIYIHCEAGMDRTGEMSGSYYLHGLNLTFADALAIDNSVESRNMCVSQSSRRRDEETCFWCLGVKGGVLLRKNCAKEFKMAGCACSALHVQTAFYTLSALYPSHSQ